MQTTPISILGPAIIQPKIHKDSRGWFVETFKDEWFRQTVADVTFIQDNHSQSIFAGTVRGMHGQLAPSGQGKLVRCVRGAIFDVVIDVRPGSPTFGRYASVTLSAADANQLWVPVGFLHGFCTLTPETEVAYKVTAPYNPTLEIGVAFDDPEIGIQWPVQAGAAILSDKDRALPTLKTLLAEKSGVLGFEM